jgi:hypothetical protein
MSDDKVLRVSIEYTWVSDRIIATDDEHGGTHALVPWETWELSKSHFIETDKLLAEYKKNEQRLVAALLKVKAFVESDWTCPICHEQNCREGNCILTEIGGGDG